MAPSGEDLLAQPSETVEPSGGTQSSHSSEIALMQSLEQSSNNNTMSTSGSELGEQQIAEPAAQAEEEIQKSSITEDFVMASSYEQIYQGVTLESEPVDPNLVTDVGDHFDTKQSDLHLQPLGHASSFEELYAQADLVQVSLDGQGEGESVAVKFVLLYWHVRFTFVDCMPFVHILLHHLKYKFWNWEHLMNSNLFLKHFKDI